MGKRRARWRKFVANAAVPLANENPSCPYDQKIPGRYRLKLSNEPKTWQEHCHRSYTDIFDSFAFMTEEISMLLWRSADVKKSWIDAHKKIVWISSVCNSFTTCSTISFTKLIIRDLLLNDLLLEQNFICILRFHIFYFILIFFISFIRT